MSIKDAKILIVEDEIQLNRVMELMLQADGYYKIRCAFDGNEALNFIKCDKPDLILLDGMSVVRCLAVPDALIPCLFL